MCLLIQYTVIALVEYLTSEEAGQPLGSRFAWPVGYIITGRGSTMTAHESDSLVGKGNGNGYLATANGSGSSSLANKNGSTTPANGRVVRKKNC